MSDLERRRVPLMLRDGINDKLTPLQQAIARDSARFWEDNQPVGRNQPGFIPDTDVGRAVKQAAYDEVEARDAEAWRGVKRTLPTVGPRPLTTPCTMLPSQMRWRSPMRGREPTPCARSRINTRGREELADYEQI